MKEPDLRDSFSYNGKQIMVDWFDIDNHENIPNIPWQQVYVVGNLNGKVPIVFYPDSHVGLPGGRTEPNESIDETIKREVREETNCELIEWVPLGYQTLHEEGKTDVNQLRVYGTLHKLGEFESDPGGSVVGYHLIDLDDLNATLEWGNSGQRLQDLAVAASQENNS